MEQNKITKSNAELFFIEVCNKIQSGEWNLGTFLKSYKSLCKENNAGRVYLTITNSYHVNKPAYNDTNYKFTFYWHEHILLITFDNENILNLETSIILIQIGKRKPIRKKVFTYSVLEEKLFVES